MFVPGLWEVEIASGADVDAVIAHVSAMQTVASADPSKSHLHSIFQLTVCSDGRSSNREAHQVSAAICQLSEVLDSCYYLL